jgi:hypothetical protein
VANAAEFKTVTIPGCQDGTWTPFNVVSAYVGFTFAAGAGASITTSTLNAWTTTACSAAPGQTNGADSTSNVMRLTGVVVLPGSQAPTAAQSPNIMRPYDQELATCQRYYDRVQFDVLGYAAATNYMGWWMPHAACMRVAPTLSLIPGILSNCTAPTLDSSTPLGCRFTIQVTTTGMGTVANTLKIADARL